MDACNCRHLRILNMKSKHRSHHFLMSFRSNEIILRHTGHSVGLISFTRKTLLDNDEINHILCAVFNILRLFNL